MADRLRGRKGQRRRARILARDPLCVLCKRVGKLRPSVEVDHIVPLSKGGSDTNDDNLRGLCRTCHRAKTADDLSPHRRPETDDDGIVSESLFGGRSET